MTIKNTILMLSLAMFVVVATPFAAEAACSYNGYSNSGGKCAKSWQKKNGKSYERIEIKTKTRSTSNQYVRTIRSEEDLEAYIEYLMELIEELKDRRDDLDSNNRRDDEPDVITNSATEIEDTEAWLRGRVDMNDFRNGLAFFVYGEDEAAVEDATDEDAYADIDEEGDDLQKVIVDSDLDSTANYTRTVTGLDEDTRHYFAMCVEYEDEDDDEALECGAVREFRTDGDSAEEEPTVTTRSATNIDTDEAELRGTVDMNDFRNGLAFFVYGEDEAAVEDATDEDAYADIDEEGDDLQKVIVDSDLDSTANYTRTVTGLDEDTRHYFAMCVEYEDEDDDEALECGAVREFRTDGDSAEEEPTVTTRSATNIDTDEAELRGTVDMNDFRNGLAFFVYGEDENDVEDATDEDRYSDIDEDGDNLQKVIVDSDIDDSEDYERTVTGLDDNTRHYVALCVEYEDENDDETLACGSVREFETDN